VDERCFPVFLPNFVGEGGNDWRYTSISLTTRQEKKCISPANKAMIVRITMLMISRYSTIP